ncbi:MAG: hypothetical protein HKM93_08765 [Desulfobacteraceae bacterium]|nr:hypothetical protein [Desulfobacteraceae bacterium]
MSQIHPEHIEDYLAGQLQGAAARKLEMTLFQPGMAEPFREAMKMRAILGALPPDTPPSGLTDQILARLPMAAEPDSSQADTKPSSASSSIRGILRGFGWSLRWPGFALNAMSTGSGVVKASGIQSAGYSLGPLRDPVSKRLGKVGGMRRRLLKSTLSKLWSTIT